jgi:hypothetical protein
MSNIRVEQYQPSNNQEIARQRLAVGKQDLLLYTHLLQASLVVERDNPLRQALTAHPQLARNTAVVIVLLLSVIVGALAPQIALKLVGF